MIVQPRTNPKRELKSQKPKTKHLKTMNKQILLTAALCAATALTARSQTLLTIEHVDIGLAFEDGLWDLHVHDETNEQEYEPDDAILFVGPSASGTVPANPLFSFLGNPGDSVWQLPSSADPNLLFLGIGAEEIVDGLFVNNVLTLTLTGISGPGHFALYRTDIFNTPTVFMNTRDGISSDDKYDLQAGGHAHFFWAFSEMGEYTLTFEASGFLDDGQNTFTSSGPVEYSFQVVPEPGTTALMLLGGAGWWFMVRRQSRLS